MTTAHKEGKGRENTTYAAIISVELLFWILLMLSHNEAYCMYCESFHFLFVTENHNNKKIYIFMGWIAYIHSMATLLSTLSQLCNEFYFYKA